MKNIAINPVAGLCIYALRLIARKQSQQFYDWPMVFRLLAGAPSRVSAGAGTAV